MKRRTFLKRTAPALAIPAALHGMRFSSLAQSSGLHRILSTAAQTDRVLVIIQLEGGNDGLNTVIPVDDDIYYNARPTIAINKEEALPLAGQPLLKLNPTLDGIRTMFDDGQLAIVSNIGYDNYSLSHFSGMEIWNTGSGTKLGESYMSGWIGRFLKEDFPDFPQILSEHPPAIQIRPAISSVFSLGNSTTGLALTDPTEFHELVTGGPNVIEDPTYATLSGNEWNYIRTINTQAVQYSDIIREAATKSRNIAEYPNGNGLADSLAIVARLIAGGLQTRVYMVTLGNFDTHGNQRQHQDRLLAQLGPAVKAFMDDLVALQVDHRVVGMTYSEFGRRIQENASGTDHGAAAAHFVFGTPVEGGRVLKGLPDLASPDDLGNLRHNITFQCYYASILAPIFELGEERLRTILPSGLCDKDDRIRLYKSWTTSVGYETTGTGNQLLSYGPNPATSEITINYIINSPGYVQLSLHTITGEAVLTAVDTYQETGRYSIHVNLAGIPSGTYLCRLHAAGNTQAQKIVVQR